MTHRMPSMVICALMLTISVGDARSAADRYHFTYRIPQVGDRGSQDIQFEMNLIVTTLTQNNQVVDTSDRGNHRKQRRTVTALEVDGDRVTKAEVVYAYSEESASQNGNSTASKQHPVVGKAYLVTRTDVGKLMVTDLEGNPPSPEEIAIVSSTMDAIGRRNPLARFFHDRTVSVGETVQIPEYLANDLLGFREAVGQVSRFQMTLTGIQTVDQKTCAVFNTTIDADSPLDDQQVLSMQGKFLVQVDTCRVIAVQLICPLNVSESRGPKGGRFTVHGKGNLLISMQAHHVHTVAKTSR